MEVLHTSRTNTGVWYGIAAHVAWGLSPIYWKQLAQVPAQLLIAHRVIWSTLTLAVLILLFHRRYRFTSRNLSVPIARSSAVAALLICTNWFIFVWAVTAGFIVEASLGYFITPLVSVGLGVIVLQERLRRWQWIAVGLATIGLVYLATALERLPWIAVVLAGTFGTYGLVKKTTPISALPGLIIETSFLCLPAAAILLWWPSYVTTTTSDGYLEFPLLASSGIITVLPLVLFSASAQRIPLAHLGIIQYLAPTLQFLLGLLLYDEPFNRTQFVGFGLVWVAVSLAGFEGLLAHRAEHLREQNE